MTKEDFLKNDSSYYGETVDDMDQVMYRNFNGEELKEYVEHHIQAQVKAGVTSEGDIPLSKLHEWCRDEGWKDNVELTVRAVNLDPIIVDCTRKSSVREFDEHINGN